MAIAFRSSSSTAYASRTNTTITAPAGLANDDIMVCGLFLGAASNPASPGVPAGWTEISGSPTEVTVGGFNGDLHVYWKRAASEGASYVFTHAAYSAQGIILAYSGCITSGSPVDASSSNKWTSGTAAVALGVTTTVANTYLVCVAHDWEASGTLSPPSGFTERLDSLIYVSDKAQAASGATGNVTYTNANPDNINYAWANFLVALKPPAAGGSTYTLAAVAGSHSLTGATASLERGREVEAVAGSYSLFGMVATLRRGRPIAANAGAYALTGTAASLELGKEVAAVAGSYALSGTAATLKFGREIAADAGSYTLTGAAAGLTKEAAGAYSIPALPGFYTLTGATATLLQTRKVAAVAGSYALTGADASLERGKEVAADAGAYTLTGTAATLVKGGIAAYSLVAAPGAYTLTGADATLRYSGAGQVDISGGGGDGGRRRDYRRKQRRWIRGAPYPWEKDEDEDEKKKKKVKKRVTVELVDEALDEIADVEGIPDWWADLNPRVVKTQISDYVLVAAGAGHQEVVEAVMTEIADELDEEEAMVLLLS